MGTRATAVVHSLSARLLLSLFLTVGLVLAIYALVSLRSSEERFGDFVRADAERCSSLIRKATHDAMLLNRKDEVQSTLERLARGSTVTAIRIYDPAGAVALSSRAEEIGQRVAMDASPCQACHRGGGSPLAASFADRQRGGLRGAGSTLRHLSVIGNEADCASAGCHAPPAEEPILGVLDVEMSTEPLDETLRQTKRQTLWTMAGLLVISGVISAGFIHRVVHRPVLELHEGTERIARGELDTRIEVAGRHELGQLASAFNRMAEDLKAARKEVVDWSRTLEDKVVEKTEELQRTQRQALHMEKMASLGKLSATVAHELNNPLSSIRTYARLVEREIGDQPVEEGVREELAGYLRLMQEECARCGTIVRNLLLFARRGDGAAMAPVDVGEVIERSLRLTRHHLEISHVELSYEVETEERGMIADVGQLEQALVALIVNAVEAMTEPARGGGELAVRLSGDAEQVRIDIADTGVGIHPDVLPHIFEPFFSTKNEESGVGLGLAVVYGIVERHGGTIEVESEPGRGSVFHLRLPRKPRVENPADGAGPAPA